jgi:hypothetical protein
MDPFSLLMRFFPNKMRDLRDIFVSLRGKFQVAKIVSDAQTVHSLHKYMRKFRAKGDPRNSEEDFYPFFCILFIL